MKKALMKVAIVLTAVGLVSCSTNTQNQNTALGVVGGGVAGGLIGSAFGGGAAVGIGAVAGALLGGVIGHNMDSTDQSNTYTSVSSGKDQSWVNHKTHTHYTVTSSGHYITINGNPYCRKFTTHATMSNGKTEKVHGVACRQKDGSWKVVQG